MADIILDTNILSEVLAQFFRNRIGVTSVEFLESGVLKKAAVKALNKIIEWHNSNVDSDFPGLIIASSFGFIEIARQFDEISADEYTIEQFAAFIEQPPEWFFIAPVDVELFNFLKMIPAHVMVGEKSKPVEWADAIHVATAFSRDEGWLLIATDARIRAIPALEDKML